jgi:hypothetical protein
MPLVAPKIEDQRISQPDAARLRGVSVRTIHRWRHNARMKFPESVEINNRHYFRLAEIANWQPPIGTEETSSKQDA